MYIIIMRNYTYVRVAIANLVMQHRYVYKPFHLHSLLLI
jgi:hypothetical protein